MAPISILIVDDSEIFRKALRELLSQEPESWFVCDEASAGAEALRKAALHLPQVMLLDLSIAGMQGLTIAAEMKTRFSELVIVIMSAQDASTLSLLARHAGLRHVLPKSSLVSELFPMLRKIRQELADAQEA